MPASSACWPACDDVTGCIEIGLADFQVDDGPASGFEGAGADEHFERGLLSDMRHARGGLDGHVCRG